MNTNRWFYVVTEMNDKYTPDPNDPAFYSPSEQWNAWMDKVPSKTKNGIRSWWDKVCMFVMGAFMLGMCSGALPLSIAGMLSNEMPSQNTLDYRECVRNGGGMTPCYAEFERAEHLLKYHDEGDMK